MNEVAAAAARDAVQVTAVELAEWIEARKSGLHVIDLRTSAEFEQDHLPTAENVPFDRLSAARLPQAGTIVLYGGGGQAAQAWVSLHALGSEHVFVLSDGLQAWDAQVMNPVADGSPEAARAAAVARYFGGTPRPPGGKPRARRGGC